MKRSESACCVAILILHIIAQFQLAVTHPYRRAGFNQVVANRTGGASISSRHSALRSKLCPGLAENVAHLYRYDKITKKCYRGGDKGPCGRNMIFYSESDSWVFGICDCDSTSHERALVFHPPTAQCYFVFSQAYCQPTQWLVFNQTDAPVCVGNPCLKFIEAEGGKEFVPFRGQCKELGSTSPECELKEVITFTRDSLFAECAVQISNGVASFALNVPRFRCSPGSAQSILGKCNPTVKYRFS